MTPVKPWGGVDGHTTTNALIGRGDVGGKGALGKWVNGLTGTT